MVSVTGMHVLFYSEYSLSIETHYDKRLGNIVFNQ